MLGCFCVCVWPTSSFWYGWHMTIIGGFSFTMFVVQHLGFLKQYRVLRSVLEDSISTVVCPKFWRKLWSCQWTWRSFPCDLVFLIRPISSSVSTLVYRFFFHLIFSDRGFAVFWYLYFIPCEKWGPRLYKGLLCDCGWYPGKSYPCLMFLPLCKKRALRYVFPSLWKDFFGSRISSYYLEEYRPK